MARNLEESKCSESGEVLGMFLALQHSIGTHRDMTMQSSN